MQQHALQLLRSGQLTDASQFQLAQTVFRTGFLPPGATPLPGMPLPGTQTSQPPTPGQPGAPGTPGAGQDHQGHSQAIPVPMPAPPPRVFHKHLIEYVPLRREVKSYGGWNIDLINQELDHVLNGRDRLPRRIRELGEFVFNLLGKLRRRILT